MSLVANASAGDNDVDYVAWNSSSAVDRVYYYYNDLADHLEFRERIHSASAAVEMYFVPVLLFFGFAGTLAMLVVRNELDHCVIKLLKVAALAFVFNY